MRPPQLIRTAAAAAAGLAVVLLLLQACATAPKPKSFRITWEGKQIRLREDENMKEKEMAFKKALKDHAQDYDTKFRWSKFGPCHQVNKRTIELRYPVPCDESKDSEYAGGGTVHVTQTMDFAGQEAEDAFHRDLKVRKE